MGESTYEKYVIREPLIRLEAPFHDFGNDNVITGHTCPDEIYLNEEVLKGCPHFMDITWFWEIPSPNPHVMEHTHDFDELVMFIGSNPKDMRDFGGEIEFWIDDEKHIIDKTAVLYIPKGIKHCPMIHKRVDKPHILVAMEVGSGDYR